MELTVDGHRVHAATGGRQFDPNLPAMIFLHGAGMDRTVWSLQSRYFAHRGHAVLVPDLAGHGQSDGEAKTSIGDWADWVSQLVTAAGVAGAVLVGHSMGSLIALETARRHPQQVTGLILLGVAPRMPVHPDLLAAAQANDRKAASLISDWGYGPTGHIGGAKIPGLYLVWGGERLLEQAHPNSLFRDLSACNSHKVESDGITCPTLLVLGDKDRMTPAKAGLKLSQMMERTEAIVIPESGHMIMLEKPDETLAAMKQFTSRLSKEGRQAV